MTGTKYIVVKNASEVEKIIVFPSEIDHIHMAKAMERLRYPTVVSAGFIDEFMQCYGESMTLRKQSRDIDTLVLKTMLSIDDKKLQFTMEDEEREFNKYIGTCKVCGNKGRGDCPEC